MKKVFVVVTLIAALILSTAVTWAGTERQQLEKPYSDYELYYTYAGLVLPIFTINEGVCDCAIIVRLKTGMDIDYAIVTTQVKKEIGTPVKVFHEKVPMNMGKINWHDTYTLPTKGTYYLHYVVKCYNSGSLVETITKDSVKLTY